MFLSNDIIKKYSREFNGYENNEQPIIEEVKKATTTTTTTTTIFFFDKKCPPYYLEGKGVSAAQRRSVSDWRLSSA